MKALIISDIHANIDALQSVVAAEPDAEAIYCAGDIVDFGLNPSEVIAFLQQHRVHTVMGNHDRYLLELIDASPAPELPQPFTFAQYCASVMSEEDIRYLRSLPESLRWEMDGIEYFMTHQYALNYSVIECRRQFEAYWQMQCPDSDPRKAHRCIFGHTHRSCHMTLDDRMLWLNPGSVSYRREDDPTKGAEYAVITDGQIRLKQIPYPHRHLYNKVCALNLTPNDMRVGRFFFSDPA